MNIKTREALEAMGKRLEQILHELEHLDVGTNFNRYKTLNKWPSRWARPNIKFRYGHEIMILIK